MYELQCVYAGDDIILCIHKVIYEYRSCHVYITGESICIYEVLYVKTTYNNKNLDNKNLDEHPQA